MLIISRRSEEKIVIRDLTDHREIVFQIVGVKAGKIRIGIEAPNSFNIVREELMEEDKKNGK